MNSVAKKVCSSCLLYEGMSLFLHPALASLPAMPVRILDDGRCSVCHLWDERFAPKLLDAECERFEEDARPVIVLFSGGKDSAAALALTKKLGKQTHALLFDNGFIPTEVLVQAQATCDRIGVPLWIERGGLDLEPALRVLNASSRTPCEACINAVYVHASRRAREIDAGYIVQGTNYFSSWKTFPLGTRHLVDDRLVIHLPFVRRQTWAQTQALLDEVGFVPSDLVGVSSNCRVPALVQARVADDIGHVPELEDLSLEIIAGHLTRAEALATLRKKAPAHAALLDA